MNLAPEVTADGGAVAAAVQRTIAPHWHRALTWVGCAALLFVVLFWRLGDASFWDPDEAHYAETTRELIRTGDWLAPYYNEQPFFDKPVLFHLLQAVPMALVGANELGARLTPALAALALVGMTWWLGAALLSAEVGLVAALLLAANPALFALARYAILDTVFTAFLFGGTALITVASLRDRPRLQWSGYVLIAFAVLTKGPLALVLCGLAFGLAMATSAAARRHLRTLHVLSGLSIVVALAAPWFVYMWMRFGDAFVAGYVFDENLRLYAGSRFGDQPSYSFYFRVLAAGLLPWTGLIVGRLFDDVRGARRRDGSLDVVEVLLWCWIAAIVGFFTPSTFKLDHYVFPAAPALCLLAARAWHDVRRQPRASRNVGARVGLLTVGPLLLLAAVAAAFFLLVRLELSPFALILPLALGVAGVSVIADTWRDEGRLPVTPWAVLAAFGITYAGLVLWVLPALEARKVIPAVAQWVSSEASPDDRLGLYRLNRWSTAFRFYVDRHAAHLENPDEAKEFFAAPGRFLCAMLEPAYQEFLAQGVPLQVVHRQEGMWATSGRALWRNPAPPAVFVIVSLKE